MFGFSIVKTKKLKALYEHSSQIATENQSLCLQLEEAKEISRWALKRYNYINGSNRTPSRKGEEFKNILNSVIHSLDQLII